MRGPAVYTASHHSIKPEYNRDPTQAEGIIRTELWQRGAAKAELARVIRLVREQATPQYLDDVAKTTALLNGSRYRK